MVNTMKKILELIAGFKKQGLIEDYAIGGAIAVLKWVEPFFTRDLDIFVTPAQGDKKKNLIDFSEIYKHLKEKGYDKWVGQWIMIDGVPVEFIPADAGLAKEAVENAADTEYEGTKTKVIRPEYLIALLLVAGRKKDIIKIDMLLAQAGINMKDLKEILFRYNLDEKFKPFIKNI